MRVVCVVLARNEDRFLERALENVSGFCDEFLLFDHGSRDGTREILDAFARRTPCARVRGISHPRASHEALKPFAGTDTWVFGVDGDEVYDPEGLLRLRGELEAGAYDDAWMVMGHCLHTDTLDEERRLARGFLAPPSRSVTKLYNFAAITSWEGVPHERLHGGRPVFRPGFSAERKRRLCDEGPWERSALRCLHLCFCRRSSLDPRAAARPNIAEIYAGRLPPALARLAAALRPSAWKNERYRRGARVSTDLRAFFPDELP